MKVSVRQCYIMAAIACSAALALRAMTDSVEQLQIKRKLAEYRQTVQAIKDINDRMKSIFSDLKIQRKSLQQRIQQTRADFRTNILLIDNRVQTKRQELASALDKLYAAAMTDYERTQALDVRKDTIDKADREVQQAVKDFRSLDNEQPGIIVD